MTVHLPLKFVLLQMDCPFEVKDIVDIHNHEVNEVRNVISSVLKNMCLAQNKRQLAVNDFQIFRTLT